ncbi:MAG: phosphoribosyltransferase [Actinobacteria bacterium]|nr:phosphoribosyltransferase [Actinomycetota bacterium]
MRFRDRTDAGRRLAQRLVPYRLPRPVVLALPRGGVPVAVEVAHALHAPLDVFVARKVGAPENPEYGIGAVAEGDGVVANVAVLRRLGLSSEEWVRLVSAERAELARRVDRYRGARPLPEVRGRDVVLVDDGLATGVTAEAALVALRTLEPSRLVLAVPTCAGETANRLAAVADDVVCAVAPDPFYAVGQSYERFDQVTDEEVTALLQHARSTPGMMAP